MIIDFRLRPPYAGYLDTGMYKDLANSTMYAKNVGVTQPESAFTHSMDLLFKEMDAAGIDIGVATGRLGHFKGSISNDDVINLVTSYPKRFVGMAGLNTNDISHALDEIDRVVLNGSLKGVVLEPGRMDKPLYANDKSIYPIYEKCDKYNIPVMLMCGGNAGPDISYSNPLITSHIARDFPNTNFIISHGGWPWVQQILGVCFFQSNIYLSPDLYFFNLSGHADYKIAANGYMQDRFLYGSAYPFLPVSVAERFKTYFKPEILPKVLWKNAVSLLKLEI